MKNEIQKILREQIGILEKSKVATEKPEKKSEDDDKAPEMSKYEGIQALLGNEMFNHAEIAKSLWGDKEATNRSLFRKKLNRELNDNGVPYEFDDEELSKIGATLRDTSKQINKTVGRKGS